MFVTVLSPAAGGSGCPGQRQRSAWWVADPEELVKGPGLGRGVFLAVLLGVART